MKRIVIEDNSEVLKFFRKNRKEEAGVRETIVTGINTVVSDKPYKIKTVKNCHYLGKTIYEYKVISPSGFTSRAAFVYDNDAIVVFFLSNELHKLDFVQVISRHKGVHKS